MKNKNDFHKCPVCGKKPKMKTFGMQTTIVCGPAIGKAHLKAKADTPNLLTRKADSIVAWNQAVMMYVNEYTPPIIERRVDSCRTFMR